MSAKKYVAIFFHARVHGGRPFFPKHTPTQIGGRLIFSQPLAQESVEDFFFAGTRASQRRKIFHFGFVKNKSMCASMLRNNLTQKRNNTVMDKQQCNSSSKSIRIINNKKHVQNSFPDDSFNEIVSQMPDSELNQLPASSRPKAGDNTAHLAPIFCNSRIVP